MQYVWETSAASWVFVVVLHAVGYWQNHSRIYSANLLPPYAYVRASSQTATVLGVSLVMLVKITDCVPCCGLLLRRQG
jgi:hypothetical protein